MQCQLDVLWDWLIVMSSIDKDKVKWSTKDTSAASDLGWNMVMDN